MNHQRERDTYIIPPNFIDTGTFFGGLFKARNVIEAGILAFAIGMPVLLFLPLGLTARIVILCLTALPAALVALIGISGESLSSFLFIFLKYLKNRRVLGAEGTTGRKTVEKPTADYTHMAKPHKTKQPRQRKGDFPAEFDEVRGYEIRQKLRPAGKKQPSDRQDAPLKDTREKSRLPLHSPEPAFQYLNPGRITCPSARLQTASFTRKTTVL